MKTPNSNDILINMLIRKIHTDIRHGDVYNLAQLLKNLQKKAIDKYLKT